MDRADDGVRSFLSEGKTAPLLEEVDIPLYEVILLRSNLFQRQWRVFVGAIRCSVLYCAQNDCCFEMNDDADSLLVQVICTTVGC